MVTPLGYAVIIDAFKAWQLQCIQCLQESGLATLKATVESDVSACISRAPGKSQQTASIPSSLEHVMRIRRREATAALRGLELAFILDLSEDRGSLELVDLARYGVWYFHHGDGTTFSSPARYFWEIFYDHKISGAMLLRRLKNDACLGTVLKEGYFPTVRTSYADNVDQCFLRSTSWPAQVCREIVNGDATYFDRAALPKPSRFFPMPTRFDQLKCNVKIALNRAAAFRQRYMPPYWNIALVQGQQVALLRPDIPGEFLADPFVFSKGSRDYVFCEQFSYAENHGKISVFELSVDGGTPPVTAIDEPFHLSYPQVFEFKGSLYCIPESAFANEVRLYEAARFPTEWKLRSRLIQNFPALDPTLLRYDSRWWMFCTRRGEGSCSDLYIWYADDLFGPWKQHAQNPVKRDARSARPAGNFFERDAALYRPAQDCSKTYGGSLTINRVRRLSTTEYEEMPEKVLYAPTRGPYRQGLHTLAFWGDRAIVDVKRYTFSRRVVTQDLKIRARSILKTIGLSDSQIEHLKNRLRQSGVHH